MKGRESDQAQVCVGGASFRSCCGASAGPRSPYGAHDLGCAEAHLLSQWLPELWAGEACLVRDVLSKTAQLGKRACWLHRQLVMIIACGVEKALSEGDLPSDPAAASVRHKKRKRIDEDQVRGLSAAHGRAAGPVGVA